MSVVFSSPGVTYQYPGYHYPVDQYSRVEYVENYDGRLLLLFLALQPVRNERSEKYAISEFPFASVSKRVLVENLSYENKFDLHENKPIRRTYFHVNSFARRVVLTQTQKVLGNGSLEKRFRNRFKCVKCWLRLLANQKGEFWTCHVIPKNFWLTSHEVFHQVL